MICSEKLSPVITSTAKRPKNPNIAILPSPISTGARSTSASRLSGSSVQFGRGEEESWSLSTWVADSRFNECEGLFTRLANCDDGGWWIEKELTVTAKTAPTMGKCSQFLIVTICDSVFDEGFGSVSSCFSGWVLSNNACLDLLTWTWVRSKYEAMWWMDGRWRWEMKQKSSVSFLRGSKAKFVRQRPRRGVVVLYHTRPLWPYLLGKYPSPFVFLFFSFLFPFPPWDVLVHDVPQAPVSRNVYLRIIYEYLKV